MTRILSTSIAVTLTALMSSPASAGTEEGVGFGFTSPLPSEGGPVIWRAGRPDHFPNYVSLDALVTYGPATDAREVVMLDWGEIAPDTVVSAVTIRLCTLYPAGPVEGLNAVIRLYDGDNGNDTDTRIEAASVTIESLDGDDSFFICSRLLNYTIELEHPVEFGDTDGQPSIPGAVFNPFGFNDIDGDGTHDFSYSIHIEHPEGPRYYVFITGVPPAGPSGGDRQTDLFEFGSFVGQTEFFRNLYMVLHAPGCNAADYAPPYGVLDTGDVTAFVGAFLAGSLFADQANPIYTIDLSDLVAFVEMFSEGCP